MNKYIRLVGTCAAMMLVLSCGCGYTTRSLIADKYKTIYVVPFDNKIDLTRQGNVGNKYKLYRPGLETEVTKSVTNKFLFDGNLKPAAAGNADVALKGELVEFRKDPLRYNNSDVVEEYRVNVVVNIGFWDQKTSTLLWEEKNFTGDTSYVPSAKTEQQAIQDAISDLSRRIVARVVDQW